MKIWLAVFLGWVVLQAGTAAAGPWREYRVSQSQPDRADRNPNRNREAERPERTERQQRPQRMSDEERRDLNRDLDKARREIYRPRREH